MEYNLMEKEEAVLFQEEVVKQCNYFYHYMHGERKEPDGAETIMKRSIELYDADWIGLIDFDLQVGAWSTRCFYNKRTGSCTETLIEEAENVEQAKRWVEAIRGGKPIIIEDVETIKDETPEEYAMYKRLHVQSVLGVPYRNCGSGLMVVRNPKKFKTRYEALNVIAYIITNEIIAKQRRDNIYRKQSEQLPSSYDSVRIELFGKISISSKDLYFDEEDMKSEALRFLIAYLACNPGKYFSAEALNSRYEGDKAISWADVIYKFRIKWKNARNLDDDKMQLILTTEKGYGFNPNLHIITDVSLADDMLHEIDDATDILAKEELLRKFHALFQGEFMESTFPRNAFIQNNRTYYMGKYLEKMNVFMKLLYDKCDYTGVQGYCSDILKFYPRSTEINFWRIMALYKQGNIGLADEILSCLKDLLGEKSFAALVSRLQIELKVFDIMATDRNTLFLHIGEEKNQDLLN